MTSDEIRAHQREAIILFLASADFTGRVLDYGCSHGPYRFIVEQHGAEWHGYNRDIYPGGTKDNIGPDHPLDWRTLGWGRKWDVILCTQVLQYVPEPFLLLGAFRLAADKLVLTYATNWPEVEPEDMHRFTRTGMDRLLLNAGWSVLTHQELGAISFGDRERIALGYGVVAE